MMTSRRLYRNVWKYTHDQTHPLIEYYEKKGVLHTVDGTQTMEDVFKNITDILGA